MAWVEVLRKGMSAYNLSGDMVLDRVEWVEHNLCSQPQVASWDYSLFH